MNFDEAQAWVERRAACAHGVEHDDPRHTITLEEITPEEQTRMILNGLLEGDDLEIAVDRLAAAAANLVRNVAQNEGLGTIAQAAAAYTFLAQILASGILLGQDREVAQ